MTTSLRSVGFALTLAASTCSTTGGEEPAATATTTSAPATTAAPTSTAGATTATTTTTTVPSPAAGELVITIELTPEEQAVVDALYAGRMLAAEAVMDPDAPGLDERLDAAFARQSQQREALEAERVYAREHGLRVRLDPDQPWRFIVLSAAVIEQTGEVPFLHAEVKACTVDTSTLYEPGGAPDGSDVIVNDDNVAFLTLYTLVVEDGKWQLLTGLRLTDPDVGATECPAEGS